MAAPYPSEATWRKSSRSNGQGQCVEFAQLGDDVVGVRDSKDTQGPMLTFAPESWRTFLTSDLIRTN
ncbi:DUF397 domain-containing protein [Catenuloplanes japonicus]|uniref:DUF397 domain-containing protein n=1 Tax=Catenuloplanes japonicus TaxID=33876 RepID=UPI000526C8E2|nr:DUF397 domain-containing protein [Catenuloplanes japonicus]